MASSGEGPKPAGARSRVVREPTAVRHFPTNRATWDQLSDRYQAVMADWEPRRRPAGQKARARYSWGWWAHSDDELGVLGDVAGADVLDLVDAEQVRHLPSVEIERADLARCQPTGWPATVEAAQVVEHGLRHLAWLVRDDPVVASALADGWPDVLDAYRPEPFRALTHSGFPGEC